MTGTNNWMNMVERSRGITLIGFIMVLGLIVFAAYLGMKLIPIYLNHSSVVSEMRAIASQPGSARVPLQTIRANLSTRFDISTVRHVGPEHIRIENRGGPHLVIAYEVREPLIGNLDAVVRFERAEPLSN